MPSAVEGFPESSGIGLYLHVPFCLRKCPYCSFFSVPGGQTQFDGYARAVKEQIGRTGKSGWLRDAPIATIFFGGGTPTVLPVELLAGLLETCRRVFAVDEDPETSLEANPATAGYRDFVRLRQAGFNRISIGVQSLADEELRAIGRPHTAEEAVQAITDARKAGFVNLNVDLMYGLPGQTVAGWKKTLGMALDLAPEHLAIYELTIEENTPFATLNRQGKLDLPDEDAVMAMMEATLEMVSAAGLHRYEISNYALKGRECRHNINYWRNGGYIGLGPGAVSCLSGHRFAAVSDVDEYCRRISGAEEWWDEVEELDPEARFRETVVMGLRMTDGVSMLELEHRFGIHASRYYGAILSRLERQGLIKREEGRLRLTPSGMNLANQVMAQLV